MSEQLKPCPFCGNKDIQCCLDGYGNHWVDCECGANLTASYATEKEAIEDWNRRAHD
jgi:Lar family restriction alleviation protein